jgi:hypothetical protein
LGKGHTGLATHTYSCVHKCPPIGPCCRTAQPTLPPVRCLFAQAQELLVKAQQDSAACLYTGLPVRPRAMCPIRGPRTLRPLLFGCIGSAPWRCAQCCRSASFRPPLQAAVHGWFGCHACRVCTWSRACMVPDPDGDPANARLAVKAAATHCVQALDGALRRGIPRGAITELVGPAGVGKSQLCHMLALLAALPQRLGG